MIVETTRVGSGELDWGVATRPLSGELLTGDNSFVAVTQAGWLLAAVDGLGHGPEAAAAGRAFVEVLRLHTQEAPVHLLLLCHGALKNTRGCAASVVTIERQHGLLSWAGVGNVEGVIHHAHPPTAAVEYIPLRGGVIGYRIPPVQPSFLHLRDGDTLVLATDGIAGDFVQAIGRPHPPDKLAAHILQYYAKPSDDALVLVARWHHPSPAPEASPS